MEELGITGRREVHARGGPSHKHAVPPHLELGADYRFNAIRFPDRNLSLDVHLLRLRVRVAYDPRLSLSTFWQYNSVDDVAKPQRAPAIQRARRNRFADRVQRGDQY